MDLGAILDPLCIIQYIQAIQKVAVLLDPIFRAEAEGKAKKWKKFDADTAADWAREISEYIPDFSGWERDNGAYQREFEKLVAALKAGASG